MSRVIDLACCRGGTAHAARSARERVGGARSARPARAGTGATALTRLTPFSGAEPSEWRWPGDQCAGDQPCGCLLASMRNHRRYLSADPLRALPLFLAARVVPPPPVPGAHEAGRCSHPCRHRQVDWGRGQSTRDPVARPLAPPGAAPGARSARFAAQARTHVPGAAPMAGVCPVGSVLQLPPSAAGRPPPVDTQGGGRLGQRSRIKSRCQPEVFHHILVRASTVTTMLVRISTVFLRKGLSRLHPAEARSTDLLGSLDA